jgi:hypothetical protein
MPTKATTSNKPTPIPDGDCSMKPYALLFALLAVSAINSGCGLLHAITNDDAAEERKAKAERDEWRAAFDASNAAILAASCEDFPEAYRQGVCFRLPNTSGPCTPVIEEPRKAMYFRMAECGHWTVFFRDAPGITWLTEIDAKYPLFDGLVGVLAQGGELFRWGNDADVRSAKRLVEWLESAPRADACPRLAAHHTALGAAVDWNFTWLYLTWGCAKESVARARPNLISDNPALRSQACTILGKFGDKSDVDKLSLLAMRDPFRDGLSYPVREACAAAANKHLLR